MKQEAINLAYQCLRRLGIATGRSSPKPVQFFTKVFGQVPVPSAKPHAHRSRVLHWIVRLGPLGLFAVAVVDFSIVPLPLSRSTDLLLLWLVAHDGSPWLLVPIAVAGSILGGHSTWHIGRKVGQTMLQRHVPAHLVDPIRAWVKRHPILALSFSGVLASVQGTAIADGVIHHILEYWVNLSVRRVSLSVAVIIFLFVTISASAQLSFTSAVDLALQNSPRVKMAQDDLNKANASLSESKSVFIPSLSGSIGAGPSYGITTSVPTIFTLNAQSLAFNFSQFDYIRAARAGVQAASATLVDVREQVEEDAAITYISMDRAQQRQKAMSDEYGYAVRLVSIVQLRLDAGMESPLELKQARRTALQIKLQQEQLEDEIASLQDYFSQLIGLPADQLGTVSSSIPSGPSSLLSSTERPNEYPNTPSVLSAEANALAKRKQAIGDSHSTWRPQIAFSAQYGRISPFNGAATYYNLNGNYNTAYAAAQVQLPFFDSTRKAKARESLAEAQHAEHTVEFLRQQQSATRVKLQHSITELETKAELAEVDQGIAQDQLNAMLVRLTSGNGPDSTPPMTPKDEMNARILERQRYLEMLDATFQLREQQIYLLRQTGQLQNWIQSAAAVQSNPSIRP